MRKIPAIYTTSQIRELERIAIEEFGIPGYELMCRAGAAAYRNLREFWPHAQDLTVICGPGNNGGDGFIVAGLAIQAGMEVRVLTCGETGRDKADALQARTFANSNKVPVSEFSGDIASGLGKAGSLLVDALLGTGLTGPVRKPYAKVIEAINETGWPILALDVPSGLNSDTGQVTGACVKADLTVTFIGLKSGLTLADGPDMCGKLIIDELGLPPVIFEQFFE